MSGIYKTNCGTCLKVYVGQTSINFEQCINEYYQSFVNRTLDYTYAKYSIEENHSLTRHNENESP